MTSCVRWFNLLALAGILLYCPFGVSATSLVVGVPRNFPPQYQLNEQERPTGLAIDIIELLSQRSGYQIEYRIYDNWPELHDALKNRHIDLIPDMGIADYRRPWADFTLPVETFPLSIFLRRETTDIDSLADFERRPVGAVAGNIGAVLTTDYPQLKVLIYPDVNSALLGMLAGTVDGLIYPRPTLEKLARDARLSDKIRVLPEPLLEVKRAIAVQKGRSDLIDEFNAHIPPLLQSREYREIYLRWHGEPKPDLSVAEVLSLFAVLLCGVVVSMALWRYRSVRQLNRQLSQAKASLEQEVDLRTRELLINQEKYRALYENAPLAYQSLDADGNFIDVNPQWLNLLGYERNQVVGHNYVDFLHPDWKDVFKTNFPAFKKRGYVSGVEFRIRHQRGHYLDIAFEGCIGYEPDGAVRQTYCVFHDITHRKQQELKREELEGQLRQKYKMEAVGHMAGGMAHNFNNNLAIVLGNLELAKRKVDQPQKLLDSLENAKTAVLRSRDMIQKILIYSRGDGVREEGGVVNVCDVVDETMRLLESTVPTSVQVRREIDTDLEPFVMVNFVDLEDALLNLCTNAVHAMDEKGQLTISLFTTQLNREDIPYQYNAEPGPFTCICVEDDGRGMDEDIVDRIFDPFYSTKEDHEGTGLGLSTVQGMVKKSGGVIRVDSSPGKGARFELLFPPVGVSVVKQEAQDDIAVDRSQLFGNERILLVDDDRDLVSIMEQILGVFGYQVTVATSGKQALSIFKADVENFDLVISDHTMPTITGLELLKEIKQLTPTIKTILCSGYSRKIDDVNVMEAGIDLFIMKPIGMNSLAQQIRALFDGRE